MLPYKAVQWGREMIDPAKLNQMVQNEEWLKSKMPTAILEHAGVKKDTQIKILAGSTPIQPQKTWSQRDTIYFGKHFSAGCKPIIMIQHYSYPQTGLNGAVYGIGNQKIPDHRGFMLYSWCDDRSGTRSKISNPFNIAYIAIGF